MTSKRKIIWVAAFVLVMAVAIVLCVQLFGSAGETHYDGTLVKRSVEQQILISTSLPVL